MADQNESLSLTDLFEGKQNIYNPDVLSCLANLSNDEVFTPPSLANQMLDLLPPEIWSDKEAKFLDPVTKSGVLLREIAKRLNEGLKTEIPDLQERLNHIFTKQIYGIAITELTSLLSRRSLYCSIKANGKFSICNTFDTPQGNIRFETKQHEWVRGKCRYCGASEEVYARDEGLETHAYEFIHTNEPENLLGKDMKFDVIIGNPPYQLSDGGGSNGIGAKPIYNLFVDQAKKMNPRYLVMIIPARWYAGGKGLNEFRNEMLKDRRIRKIVDFPKSRECFSGVDIAGGVCYFLIDFKYSGNCEVVSMASDSKKIMSRSLDEFGVFVRDNLGVGVVKKILSKNENKVANKVLSRNSFGFTTSARGENSPFQKSIKLISSSGVSYIPYESVTKNRNLINLYKISVGTLNPDRGGVNNAKDGMVSVTTKVKILNPKEVVTETYIIVDYYEDRKSAINCANYIKTKFVRYLIYLTLSSMHIVKDNFQFVPMQDFNESWTDEKLYAKYGLTQEEIDFIESIVRPMDLSEE